MVQYKQLMLMVVGIQKQEDKMDFYRSLSVQGIYQTVCVAEKIKEDVCEKPEFIFAPTSLYARQSAEIVHQTFSQARLVFRDNLYAANEKNLWYFLKHLDDIFDNLLILGEKNPMARLTCRLTGQKLDLKASESVCIHWSKDQLWCDIKEHDGQLLKSWSP